MAWHDESAHPFAGIAEKLKRADQNIDNLQSEIGSFFGSCKYPILPNENTKEWREAVDYHKILPIPVRFPVLCGEIVHHLRSCLDHIAWHFSSASYRRTNENSIAFPVLHKPPIKPNELARYERNIEGISNSNVRRIIEELQPYKRGDDVFDDPICIVHDMDRFDKHRELAVMIGCAGVFFSPGTEVSAIAASMKFSDGKKLSTLELAAVGKALKNNAQISPQIAFTQFGQRKTRPVIPSLSQLLNAVVDVVEIFACEI